MVVPIPTNPLLATMKFVAVEEPMTNDGPVPITFGLMERKPHGEVVPSPRFPLASILILSLPLVEKLIMLEPDDHMPVLRLPVKVYEGAPVKPRPLDIYV